MDRMYLVALKNIIISVVDDSNSKYELDALWTTINVKFSNKPRQPEIYVYTDRVIALKNPTMSTYYTS